MENKKMIELPKETVKLGNPIEMSKFATTLKEFIVKENLFTNIMGKNYVNVEGWQFTGAVMGILPHLESNKRLERGEEIAYEAHVVLKTLDGNVVGSAVAICSNKESKKKSFDEYAVMSMAHTRAVSKAFRITFGWLMKMAGYEATPAEEMDETTIKVGGKTLPKPDKVEPKGEVAKGISKKESK